MLACDSGKFRWLWLLGKRDEVVLRANLHIILIPFVFLWIVTPGARQFSCLFLRHTAEGRTFTGRSALGCCSQNVFGGSRLLHPYEDKVKFGNDILIGVEDYGSLSCYFP